MDTTYFGFRENPFTVTPDPRFFYVNRASQEVYASLLSGIRERKGFLLLTGEAGTGKTTLLCQLMSHLEAPVHCIFFDSTNLTNVTFEELLRLICAELGLLEDQRGSLRKLQALNASLMARAKEGGTGVLLIDEAHNLRDEVLGTLHLLAPLDTSSEKLLLQTVLVGQPELERKLAQPKLRQLKQRIALQCRLDGLEEREVGLFIHHRLRTVGYDRQDLFVPEAIQRIAVYSKGVPQLINIICDNALLSAAEACQRTVSVKIIDEVAHNLRIREQFEGARPFLRDEDRQFQQEQGAEAYASSREAGVRFAILQPQGLENPDVVPAPGETSRSPSWSLLLSGFTFLTLLTLGLLYYWRLAPVPSPPALTLPVITWVEPTDVNRPPLITAASPAVDRLEVTAGEEQSFSVEAADPDTRDRLVYVWLLDGHEVARGQQWRFAPSVAAAKSQHQVTVAVADKEGAKAEKQWTVAVVKALPQPPVITRVTPTAQEVRVAEGQKLTFALDATSPQAGPLQYVWFLDGHEQGRGRTWTYRPQFDEGGPTLKEVTGRVTDRDNHTVERHWQMGVQDVNRPPLITAASPAGDTLEVTAGEEQSFSVKAADPDAGDRLVYVWLLDGQEVARGPQWRFRMPAAPAAKTPHQVEVKVSDTGGLKNRLVWNIVTKVPPPPPRIVSVQPPEVVSPPALPLSEGEVRAWLEVHRHAWEEKNVDLLVELGVVAGQRAERAREILSRYKNFNVALQGVDIHIAGNRAEVSFSRVDTIDGKAVSHPDRKVFILERGANSRLTARPQ